jgi:hypothetical protein
MIQMYPKRTVLGLALMSSQAFLYNAIFFTYALLLSTFHGVPEGNAGWYLLALPSAACSAQSRSGVFSTWLAAAR